MTPHESNPTVNYDIDEGKDSDIAPTTRSHVHEALGFGQHYKVDDIGLGPRPKVGLRRSIHIIERYPLHHSIVPVENLDRPAAAVV
jgi:hypothetical protein